MALSKSSQAPQASISQAAAGSTTGSSLATNYGVSGVAKIINGATGPTVGCDFVIQVSNDSGTTWFEWSRQTASNTNSATTLFPFRLTIGNGADFGNYRTLFVGNTAQAVTIQADAETTTAL